MALTNAKGVIMGLFNKETKIETADALFEKFNGLSESEKTLFMGKVAPKQEPVDDAVKTGDNEPEAPKSEEKSAESVEEPKQPDGEVVNDKTATKPEEPKAESFEEMFKRFMVESKKEVEELKNSVAEIKKQNEQKTEKKPFGLTEESKEYKSNYKPNETSQEFIKRLFNK